MMTVYLLNGLPFDSRRLIGKGKRPSPLRNIIGFVFHWFTSTPKYHQRPVSSTRHPKLKRNLCIILPTYHWTHFPNKCMRIRVQNSGPNPTWIDRESEGVQVFLFFGSSTAVSQTRFSKQIMGRSQALQNSTVHSRKAPIRRRLATSVHSHLPDIS